MKLNELLLLELRELLDRTIYGEWIDSNTGEIYPIEQRYGHENWLETHFYPSILNKESPSLIDNEDMYDTAFEYGMVRVSHPVFYQLNVEGFKEPIKRVNRIIAVSLPQEDLQHFTVNIITKKGQKYTRQHKSFRLPPERAAAQDFLKNL
jgi:DNA primase large subunit